MQFVWRDASVMWKQKKGKKENDAAISEATNDGEISQDVR